MQHGVSFILGKTGAVNHLPPPGATAQIIEIIVRAVVCGQRLRGGTHAGAA